MKKILAVAGLAVVYAITARLGLAMDAVAGFATLVWPPTGIALAALVLYGYRLWPGVFLGAVAANVWAGAPVLVALGIGVGNTLEAVVGTYALRRIRGFHPSLERLPDALGLIVLAAILSTMLSATVGVASLYAGGMVPLSDAAETWRAWWVGDLIGDLVVAPVLLTWLATPRTALQKRRAVEALALTAAVIVITALVFGRAQTTGSAGFVQAYMIFPPLIWAALRFGQRGMVTMTLLTSVVAVWGTALGRGPFAQPVLYQGLFALETFLAVAAATFLLLGASIAERRRAFAAAAEANRAKSEFLAVMSHELRTPLNAIAGYVELLTIPASDPITETQRAYLSRIQTNQQHLLSMIEDVLSFAKVEAGRIALSLESVRVNEAIAALDALVRPDIDRKRLTLTHEIDDPSLTIRCDPEKLRQTLLNLLTNAIKFTPEQGQVTVGADRRDATVRIWVRDTGIGIPADQLERIFEPFFQVDRGMTRGYPGIGLGLAIARDFARAMGGDVRMESEPGRGSTAWVELPEG